MKWLSRRGLLGRAWTPLLLASPLALTQHAAAETAQYLYDPLGRLVRVTLSDGTIIVYDYDAAGNRTRMVRSDGSAFNATLQVTGSGPVNLRTIADQAGYTGATNATIIFQVGSAVTINGAPGNTATPGGRGIDTGLWPSSSHTIALTLQVSGKVHGGGGGGGRGSGLAFASLGTVGGDAIYAQENLTVVVNAGGQVKAGGGGGGGGGGWFHEVQIADDPPMWVPANGAGGGGGFPNGSPGAPGDFNPEWPLGNNATGGSGGTTGGGGAGGSGGSAGGGRTTGGGGAGAAAATAGVGGAASTGSETATWVKYPPAGGGQAGYAVRKNGKTVGVTNNGTIVGAQG